MKKYASPPDIYPNFAQRLAGKTRFQRLVMTALPFIPRHAYHPFISELRIALRRLFTSPSRVRRKYRDLRDLRVNIGCGLSAKPEWVNLDFFPFPGVNCLHDCRRGLPFSDDSVKCIFTEHFFEHIDYIEEVPFFLSECYRVLKPGGVIRIIVPDAEKYLRAYCAEGWEEIARIRPLLPDHTDGDGSRYNTKMEVVNAVFRRYFEHKYAYDFSTLEFVLRRYGFCDVQRQSFGKSVEAELSIDKADRATESLYVEAVKPEHPGDFQASGLRGEKLH
jgi:predicted SAM-dependent methyltransferase